MDRVIERLKTEFPNEDARYAYADSVANAFLTAQIKALRDDRGLTQEKLAELVGTQQSGISRWLNSGFSGCRVETLRKFAKAYGVRLRISFEAFGTLPTDVRGFTEDRLAPPKFEDDPAFKQPAVEESAAVARRNLAGLVDVDAFSSILFEENNGLPVYLSQIRDLISQEGLAGATKRQIRPKGKLIEIPKRNTQRRHHVRREQRTEQRPIRRGIAS